MKLLDILARELKEWPRTYMGTATEAVSQDAGGDLNNLDDGSEAHINQMIGSFWSGSDWSLNGITLEEAEDYKTAIVTRAQWQAAVDALKTEWSGEGLPPVGTVCEGRVKNGGDWRTYTVKATSTEYLIVWCEEDMAETPLRQGYWEFRPIRTPEQIAEEEREAAIQNGMAHLRSLAIDEHFKRVLVERLYDCGWQKVQP